MKLKRHKQLLFNQLNLNAELSFGGSLLKDSHAKVQRPISIKRAMHLVLRSSLCKGRLSFLESKNSRQIERILKDQADLHQVKIYKIAKACNHIHIVLIPKTRHGFIGFMRSVTGLIPRALLKTERGAPAAKKFWDKRPWTRILSWGPEFKIILKYLEQNTLEAFGFIPYQPRESRFNSA